MSPPQRRRAVPFRQVLCLAAVITAGAGVGYAAEAAASCHPQAAERGIVQAVIDHRTVGLADGRVVRLAGLEDLASVGLTAGDAPRSAPAQARTVLDARARGKPVLIQAVGHGPDRYGRQVALVFPADSPERALQQDLIAAGHGVVSSRIGHPGCAGAFLGAERAARAARLGLWGDPYYHVAQAERPVELAAARGRFALVEGQVLSVGDRSAVIYLNFGRRWSEDFTVTILKRNERHFISAGLAPKTLAGHRVRIRGWLDQRGGPWIEAANPEQIERAGPDQE